MKEGSFWKTEVASLGRGGEGGPTRQGTKKKKKPKSTKGTKDAGKMAGKKEKRKTAQAEN